MGSRCDKEVLFLCFGKQRSKPIHYVMVYSAEVRGINFAGPKVTHVSLLGHNWDVVPR
jgi:hypothetical protein